MEIENIAAATTATNSSSNQQQHEGWIGKYIQILKDPRLIKRYAKQLERRNSFAEYGWKKTFISPIELARNGFFTFGYDDIVTCAFCFVTIGNFDEKDIGGLEELHFKYSPRCPFLANEECGNIVDQGDEELASLIGPKKSRSYDEVDCVDSM
jgi:hypothetical protein